MVHWGIGALAHQGVQPLVHLEAGLSAAVRVARRQCGAQHMVASALDARDEDQHWTIRDRLCHWWPALGLRQRE